MGNGPLREYLINVAENVKLKSGSYIKTFHMKSCPKYYNDVGFLLAPSRTEAQGVAMCKALACGTPTIATKVDGIPGFVIHGYNDILVKPGPVELRRVILNVVKMSTKDYCKMTQNTVN